MQLSECMDFMLWNEGRHPNSEWMIFPRIYIMISRLAKFSFQQYLKMVINGLVGHPAKLFVRSPTTVWACMGAMPWALWHSRCLFSRQWIPPLSWRLLKEATTTQRGAGEYTSTLLYFPLMYVMICGQWSYNSTEDKRLLHIRIDFLWL